MAEGEKAPVQDSLFAGLAVCWLLNLVHLGIAYFVFVAGERFLPAVFGLVAAIGLLQIGYVAPIWYVLRRNGKNRIAMGVTLAAAITLLFNATFWLYMNVP